MTERADEQIIRRTQSAAHTDLTVFLLTTAIWRTRTIGLPPDAIRFQSGHIAFHALVYIEVKTHLESLYTSF
jgi:hypothetical protein